ncbi:hypothetical protein Verru16b_01730 [Lacunisphaera limnophila]|uniref:PepSY-associated TM helix n=1 Tax=Lacunisphaera limnophila TaxID=1838286 RepID=A0A1D8AUV3_9BACT|nr:PepSY-associated TM helix domain-containing protein [Lacunisphaera limnophila]AOS44663.1 hypothetical protein Verru16b_01730 [Lacunisphaera limnophila]
MRKRLWQLHSWLGLAAGLGLLVIGLTGSLLIFHEELELIFNPGMVRVEPTPAGRPDVRRSDRLPLDTLLRHAQRQLPGHEVTGWLPQYEAPHLADMLYVIERGNNVWLVATLDPYTGKLLASPRLGTTTITGWLLELHYMFLADHFGLGLAGLFALMLCLLGVSGVWLYREFWKNVFTLRWHRGARILFSDLHKFTGITFVVFNLIVGFTGAYWNLTHLVGHWINGDPPQPQIGQRLYPDTLSLDALTRDAAQRLPGFRGNFISLPSDPAAPSVIFWGTIEPRGAFTGPYGSTVSYDPQTGAHTATSDLRTQGRWARIADTFTPLHYGTFGGLPVKILWCLGGLTPGLLGITGFLIWFRRQRPSPELARHEFASPL